MTRPPLAVFLTTTRIATPTLADDRSAVLTTDADFGPPAMPTA